jgi:hypothetical protein
LKVYFISLFSGVLAGIILAGVNCFVAEPFIEQAIGFEVENSIVAEEVVDYKELNAYRIWWNEGTFAAGSFLGLTYGAILGIVFIVSRKCLPPSIYRKKAIALEAITCLSLYVIRLTKSPANLPAVGDHETIGLKDSLYTGFQSVTMLIILGLGIFLFKFRKVSTVIYLIPILYLGLIILIYCIFISNPGEITSPMELVDVFRIVTYATMGIFYLILVTVFGDLSHRFKLYEIVKVTTTIWYYFS